MEAVLTDKGHTIQVSRAEPIRAPNVELPGLLSGRVMDQGVGCYSLRSTSNKRAPVFSVLKVFEVQQHHPIY